MRMAWAGNYPTVCAALRAGFFALFCTRDSGMYLSNSCSIRRTSAAFRGLNKKPRLTSRRTFEGGHVHLAMDAGALKPQRIRMPLAFEVMFSAKVVSDFLHESARVRERKVVTPDKCDIGHSISPSAEARS